MSLHRPVIPLTILISAGIIVGEKLSIPFRVSIPCLILVIIVAFIFYIKNFKKTATVVFFISIFFAGCILVQYKEIQSLEKRLNFGKKNFMWVEGIILEPLQIKDGRCQMVMELHKAGNDWSLKRQRLKAIVYFSIPPEMETEPEWGQKAGFNAIAYYPREPTNPYQFDYGKYLRREGISIVLFTKSLKDVRITGRQNINSIWFIVFSVRKKMTAIIRESLPQPLSNLLVGIVFGERKELPVDLETAFKNAGTLHLLAASGLNVSIVIGAFLLLFSIFKIKLQIRYILAIPPVIFYAMLAGASPPIVRASLMGIIFLVALAIEREYDPLNALFIAAFVMLLINPYNLFSASFQLSFIATMGIILFYKKIRDIFIDRTVLYGKIKNKITSFNVKWKWIPYFFAMTISTFYEIVISTVIISIIAQFCLIPVIAYYFNSISLANIPGNLALVPICSIALPAGLFGGLVGLIIPFAGKLIITVLYHPLNFAVFAARLIANLPMASVPVPTPGIALFIVYYAFLVIVFGAEIEYIRVRRFQIASLLLIISVFFILLGAWKLATMQRIVFFDMEHVSVILIEKRGVNSFVLFSWKNPGKSSRMDILWAVAPYLRKRGINHLDLLVLLGQHGSTFPEIDKFTEEFNPGKIFVSDNFMIDSSYCESIKLLQKRNSRVYYIDNTIEIKPGEDDICLETVSYRSPYILKYRWQGGKLFLVNYKNPVSDTLKMEMRSASANMVIFCVPPEIKNFKKISSWCEGRPFISIAFKDSNLPEILCPRRDGALIFDISGIFPKKIKWR